MFNYFCKCLFFYDVLWFELAATLLLAGINRLLILTPESHWFSFTSLLFWSSTSCLWSWTESPPCTYTLKHTPPAAFNPDRLTNLWVFLFFVCVYVTSSNRPSVATAVCWPLTEHGHLPFDHCGVDLVLFKDQNKHLKLLPTNIQSMPCFWRFPFFKKTQTSKTCCKVVNVCRPESSKIWTLIKHQVSYVCYFEGLIFVVFIHADSFGAICPGFEISVSTLIQQWRNVIFTIF